MELKITPSGQTIVKPTALGPVANTDSKLLIYGLFQKGRVLAQDGVSRAAKPARVARFTLDAPEHSGTIPGARGDILTPGVALTSNLAVIFTLNQHSETRKTTTLSIAAEFRRLRPRIQAERKSLISWAEQF